MTYNLMHVNANEFLQLWQKFNDVGASDPTQAAINRMFMRSVDIDPVARRQLENLVAYWRMHAKPGRVYSVQKAWHYAQNYSKMLQHWNPDKDPSCVTSFNASVPSYSAAAIPPPPSVMRHLWARSGPTH